ncbi:MAG: type IV toxin-antitoxin system AbiEi family antitoxin [Elusimicrobia bacterium]|nr:type IV toxin-antitoxin system AbiEi family antitoxin [Candidatus Liberimonas magnetica]
MTIHIRYRNVFSDKASVIARCMLLEPKKEWVVRDFVKKKLISIGLAQGVFAAMDKLGYVEREKKGPDSYTILTNKKKLLEDWVKEYDFGMNEIHTYYSSDRNVLSKIKKYLDKNSYAITLHAGANLITSYVKSDDVYLYLRTDKWEKDILDIRQKLDLKELVKGGNVHIIRPFYKSSAYFNNQMINGCPVVSNLQLYLDLYHYQPRGREHAEYLKKTVEEKGKQLA